MFTFLNVVPVDFDVTVPKYKYIFQSSIDLLNVVKEKLLNWQ